MQMRDTRDILCFTATYNDLLMLMMMRVVDCIFAFSRH